MGAGKSAFIGAALFCSLRCIYVSMQDVRNGEESFSWYFAHWFWAFLAAITLVVGTSN